MLPNGCWQWNGSLRDEGYGHLCVNGTTRRAARVAFELFVRELGTTEVADHLCTNRGCVNPAHLQAVDNRTNVLRGHGLSAQNARKSACKRGHLFSPENTRLINGARVCRTCQKELMRARRATYRKQHPVVYSISAETIRQILREPFSVSRNVLAKKYNVSGAYISMLRRGQFRKVVTLPILQEGT